LINNFSFSLIMLLLDDLAYAGGSFALSSSQPEI